MSNDNRSLSVKVQTLRQYLGAAVVKEQIQHALPKGLSVDRVLRQVFTLVQTNTQLLDCTQQSIVKAIIQASELGLDISGPLGQAYLIPRRNRGVLEATFQLGWKGVLTLAYRGGNLATFRLKTVYANDEFAWEEGTRAFIRHRPCEQGDRGKPTHYYAIASTPTGQIDFEVMTHAEVVAHRLRYSPPPKEGKADYSAWATSFDAMAQKTVAIRLARRLPASAELQTAVAEDESANAQIALENQRLNQPTRSDLLASKLNDVMLDDSEVSNEEIIESEPSQES